MVIHKMRKQKEGQSANESIFVERSLAPILDEEDMPTLSDVGGLASVAETEHEMEIVGKADRYR
jgi:hypothetical protein